MLGYKTDLVWSDSEILQQIDEILISEVAVNYFCQNHCFITGLMRSSN